MSWERLNPKNEPSLMQDGQGVAIQRMHWWRYALTGAQATADAANNIHVSVTMTTATQTITTNIVQPTCPRCLSVTGGADQTGIVTVHGTNINGDPISESFTMISSTLIPGAKAFKSVTSIVYPPYTVNSTKTVVVGDSDILGLPVCLASAVDVETCSVNGTKETVAGVSVSSTVICSNTVDPTSALAGTAIIFTGVLYS